jgi:hypothetical protein
MSKQSAVQMQKQYERSTQDHQEVAEPRIAPARSIRGCMAAYEAADRNAEMIEEMAEDREIAQHVQGSRRVHVVLQFSGARTKGRSPLHRQPAADLRKKPRF